MKKTIEICIKKGSLIIFEEGIYEIPNDINIQVLEQEIVTVSRCCTGVVTGGRSELTKIEVVTGALRDAGFTIVDYKSNHDGQKFLTGLVIAPLKD